MRRALLAIPLLFFALALVTEVVGEVPGRRTAPPAPPFLTPREATATPTAATAPTVAPIARYGTLRGRVYDRTTKRLVGARIELTNTEGKLVGGSAKDCPVWVRGAFALRLPAGNYRLAVRRGPFYAPYRDVPYITIDPDKVTEVELPLAPWFPARQRGWHGFDPFVVTASGLAQGPIPSIPLAALIAEAEGCDAVFLAEPWWDSPPPNIDATTDPAKLMELAAVSSTDMLRVSTSVLNDSRPYYGWFYALGGNTIDKPKPVDDPLVPNATHMAAARADGAVVVVKNPSRMRTVRLGASRWSSLTRSTALFGELLPVREGYASELPFDLHAGVVDAIEVLDDADLKIWYAALNRGFRVTALRSSGVRMGSEPGALPVPVNFAAVRGSGSVKGIQDAIRSGAVIFGNGPFVEFTVDSRGVGSEVPADGQDHFAVIKCYARAIEGAGVKTIELIRNGAILRSYGGDDIMPGSAETVALPGEVRLRETDEAWYIVRATDLLGGVTITNPIWFRGKTARPLPSWLPGKLVVSTGQSTDVTITVKLDGTERKPTVLQRSPGLFEVTLIGGFPPGSELVVANKDGSSVRLNIFEHAVFRKLLRAWSLADARNPSLEDTATWDEFRHWCGTVEIDAGAAPEGAR